MFWWCWWWLETLDQQQDDDQTVLSVIKNMMRWSYFPYFMRMLQDQSVCEDRPRPAVIIFSWPHGIRDIRHQEQYLSSPALETVISTGQVSTWLSPSLYVVMVMKSWICNIIIRRKMKMMWMVSCADWFLNKYCHLATWSSNEISAVFIAGHSSVAEESEWKCWKWNWDVWHSRGWVQQSTPWVIPPTFHHNNSSINLFMIACKEMYRPLENKQLPANTFFLYIVKWISWFLSVKNIKMVEKMI